MPTDREHIPPEAGADTDPEGRNPRPADSGGHRTAAGSDYGDYVPDRGQPRRNDDRDAAAADRDAASDDGDGPPMGDYYAGGGDLERVAGQPVSEKPSAPSAPSSSPDDSGAEAEEKNNARRREQHAIADSEERVAEANRNKSFDTPHVHSSTTSRRT